jgi:hypothetical protein
MKTKQILIKVSPEQYSQLCEKVAVFNKENNLELSVQAWIRRKIELPCEECGFIEKHNENGAK